MKSTEFVKQELEAWVADVCRIYRHEVLVYPETARTPEKFAHDYVLHMTSAMDLEDDKEEKETK